MIETLEELEQIVYSFKRSAVFFSALNAGVFETLGSGSLTAQTIAENCQLDLRATTICCDALAAIGILIKEKGAYSLPEVLQGILVDASPTSRSSMYRYQSAQMDSWSSLGARLTGADVFNPLDSNSSDAVTGSIFGHALESVARSSARLTAQALDLSKTARLLDLGGGTGSYLIEFLKVYPDLSGTLFECSAPIEIARKNARDSGLSDRIEFITGDMFNDQLGEEYDFVFISNVLHMFSPERNTALLKRAESALKAGGTLCIKDFYLSPERTAPVGSALFSVNMLLRGAGNCYTDAEISDWLGAVGLHVYEKIPLAAQSQLILASAPCD